ncbi:hypothetical protein GHT06_010605 [Daphnia sinensis]|uniref:Gustatory receptor n=1 Tax=Daphnia sinensis TaxID=1820382 RepID=A0AAD5PXL4_9CRUS|nr:hypothetical protein GHT06_010605 [Daphnia sinensis]
MNGEDASYKEMLAPLKLAPFYIFFNHRQMLSELRQQGIREAKKTTANITLDETLRPLWKLTYYCGILLDWCRPISENDPRFWKATRYLSIVMSSFLLLAVFTFELAQLFIGIERSLNVHLIILNIVWCIPVMVGVVIQEQFLRHRREFLGFFKGWRRVEMEITKLNPDCIMCKSRRMHVVMYAIHGGLAIAGLISIGIDIFNRPDEPYLISHYKSVRDLVPLLLICFVHLAAICLTLILLTLSDLVTSFTYYHAGLAVDCLERDARIVFARCFNTEDRLFITSLDDNNQPENVCKDLPKSCSSAEIRVSLQLIWARFDNVDQLINQANSLFGKFLVCSQGVSLFMITALLYSVFYYLGDALRLRSTGLILPYVMNFLSLGFRFISSMLISAQLHRSVGKFRMSLNYLLSQHWNQMSKQDRDLLRSFLSRLYTDSLVACPLGLYNITPSILLSIIGLVVSYVIVLLQSK